MFIKDLSLYIFCKLVLLLPYSRFRFHLPPSMSCAESRITLHYLLGSVKFTFSVSKHLIGCTSLIGFANSSSEILSDLCLLLTVDHSKVNWRYKNF